MTQFDTDAARECQAALLDAGVSLSLLQSDGPVFAEPWQAQAFAVTLALHDRGFFTWDQWAKTLGESIKAAQMRGDPDSGQTYYHHWLSALERITIASNVCTEQQLTTRQSGWRQAVARTPHGLPIELTAAERELPET